MNQLPVLRRADEPFDLHLTGRRRSVRIAAILRHETAVDVDRGVRRLRRERRQNPETGTAERPRLRVGQRCEDAHLAGRAGIRPSAAPDGTRWHRETPATSPTPPMPVCRKSSGSAFGRSVVRAIRSSFQARRRTCQLPSETSTAKRAERQKRRQDEPAKRRADRISRGDGCGPLRPGGGTGAQPEHPSAAAACRGRAPAPAAPTARHAPRSAG